MTNGTVVAECYTDDTQGLQRERLDRLERSITLLTKSQNSAGSELSVLTNQTKQALYNLLDKLDTAQYTASPTRRTAFCWPRTVCRSAPGRRRISPSPSRRCRPSTTASRHSSTRCRPSPPQRTAISAARRPRPPSGRYCRALADADPATLQKILADGFPAADTNRAGQIATGFSWKFYAVCDLDTAARLTACPR